MRNLDKYFEFWRYKCLLRKISTRLEALPSRPTPLRKSCCRKLIGHATYTVVSACYNVEKYLPTFFDSLIEQRLDFRRNIKIICVDDGSQDKTASIIKQYAERFPENITYIYQENGGQASARNLGLKYVSTPWVGFVDPDDYLDFHCLYEVDKGLAQHPNAALLSMNMIFYLEDCHKFIPNHPLSYKYKNPYQVKLISDMGDCVQCHQASAFFRTDVIRRHKLESDSRIKPALEDAHFVSQYLLHVQEQEVLFLRKAKYYYRKRSDGSSSMDSKNKHKGTFSAVLQYGHLDLQERYAKAGITHDYIKHFFFYDIMHSLRDYLQHPNILNFLSAEEKKNYLSLIRKCFSYISSAEIEHIDINGTNWFWKLAFMACFKQQQTEIHLAVPVRYDAVKQEVCLRVFCGAMKSKIIVTAGGTSLSPTAEKRLVHRLADEALLEERIMWLPMKDEKPLLLTCNDRPVAFCWQRTRRPDGGTYNPRKFSPPWIPGIGDYLVNSAGKTITHYFSPAPEHDFSLSLENVQQEWGKPALPADNQYAHCWLFCDREEMADDNAEHLYRYVAQQSSDFPIYFVLSRTSPDWERLSTEGFRLIPYGSAAHRAAMKGCDAWISSQIGVAPYLSPCESRIRQVFLQHGITLDDMHGIFNNVTCDLFATTTQAEHESIVGNDSLYRFTTKETQLLGFCRHDRLLALNRDNCSDILIMPTWRSYLGGLSAAEFAKSEYTSAWKDFLHHPYLRELVEKHGYTISLQLHPAVRQDAHKLAAFECPSYIQTCHTQSYQELFCKAIIGITDFSSAAAEMAFLQKATLYYQFDKERFLSEHTHAPGYFCYERDGFGPVCYTLNALIEAMKDLVSHDSRPDEKYVCRMKETFSLHDGKNCERTYQAILRSLQR